MCFCGGVCGVGWGRGRGSAFPSNNDFFLVKVSHIY